MASLVLGGQLAWADTPSPPFAGVWAGTIGTARVQVCLAGDDGTEYYYLRHKRGIRLQASGAADNPRNEDLIAKALGSGRLELDERSTGTTLERRFTGRWKLQPDDRGGLSGTWSAPGGGQPLPVQLARLTRPFKTRESYPGGDPCHPSFYEPLKSGLRFTYSAAAFEGHLYRGVATGQAVAFEVPADTPHAAKINAYAIDWLKNQAVLAYQCDIGRGAGEAALDSSLTPLVWSETYLVLQDLLPDANCGGAHGNSSLSTITWSLQRGEPVDTWSWIQGGQDSLKLRKDAAGADVESGLLRLLQKKHPRNQPGDECAEVVEQMSLSAPYPAGDVLVFPTSFFHAMRACMDDVRLSWKEMAPFLSNAGRAAMAASTKAARYSPR